jgi:hypothetical protein
MHLSLMMAGAGLLATGCSRARLPANTGAGHDGGTKGKGLFFNAEEMVQLAEVVEIIIPTTDTPGARSANVHGFIDAMMAEWAVPKTQASFRALLGEIDSAAKQRFGSGFMDLSPKQRLEVVSAMDAAAFSHRGGEGKRVHPFARLKELVFVGYYQSEIGATQELQFKLVPGRYEACVPLSNIGHAWADDWGVFFASLQSLSECDCSSGADQAVQRKQE